MPVPPNQTSTTAISIGTLTGYTAFSTTQDAFSTVGTTTVAIWYKYTPVAGDDVLEVYGYGNGTTYLPRLDIFSGPASVTTSPANTRQSLSRPAQQDIITDIVPGEDVYFRFFHAVTTLTTAVTTIRIARGQKELIADGDLYINDSSEGYPGIVMSPTTAIPKRYQLDYPAGEGQQTLQNGIVSVIDAFTPVAGPRLFDVATNGFTARAIQPVMPDNQYTDGLSTNQTNTFVATAQSHGGGNSLCVFITASTGVVSSPLDLGSPNFSDVVPQANLSAVYGEDGSEIRKVTNPGGVNTLFLTVDATFNFGINLLMMTDDTLLVVYEKAATVPFVKRFSLSAVLLNTITLTGVTAGIELESMFAAKDDPVHFWVWWQTSVLNRFQKYRVSDGALITDLSRNKFIESVSQTTILAADTVFSGADFSCKPTILRLSAAGSGAGLYKLTGTNIDNPAIRHDKLWVDASLGTTIDVAIPNPFAESYLVGDE